jgi:nucleoside-triphosphatase
VADSPANILVTGRPGIGKTTLIRSVLHALDLEAGGFYTSEILDDGRRVGFSIDGLHGESGVLAHVDHESPFRVGKYGVNAEDLERVGVAAIDAALERSRLIVMDEIGRMERRSSRRPSGALWTHRSRYSGPFRTGGTSSWT